MIYDALQQQQQSPFNCVCVREKSLVVCAHLTKINNQQTFSTFAIDAFTAAAAGKLISSLTITLVAR